MWMFWIIAGGMAAAAAALVIARAAAAGRTMSGSGEDPAMPIYRRQLDELDGLAERGLLGPQEIRAARTEAARRLLSASQSRATAEHPGGRATRLVVALGAAGAGLTALALYVLLGSPGLPDQPYGARVRAWRASDPSSLDPGQMAAVLRSIAAQRPNDPQVFDYLGRAELASGDGFAAAHAFQHAAAVSPPSANLQAELGEALVADNDGKVSPEASAAFSRAVALDPANAPARYYLGREAIAAGDVAGGLNRWRALAAQMPAADPRRAALVSEIDHVAGAGPTGANPASPTPQAGAMPAVAPGQMAFIRAMVASQAADLRAHPDNPDGWARLVRSYGVLGDKAAQQQALSQAQALFANRPDVMAKIRAEASAAVPTTTPGMPGG